MGKSADGQLLSLSSAGRGEKEREGGVEVLGPGVQVAFLGEIKPHLHIRELEGPTNNLL